MGNQISLAAAVVGKRQIVITTTLVAIGVKGFARQAVKPRAPIYP